MTNGRDDGKAVGPRPVRAERADDVTNRDYAELASPLAGDAPTGVDIRRDPEGVLLYRRIKDARQAARSEDRSAEAYVVERGNEGDAIARPSERWREVHDLAREALETRTKDIELFAWLAEAAIRLRGFEALAGVVGAMRSLIVERFEALHSIDDETPADKAIPLAGLNGQQDSEGTLIRPLRLCPLAPGHPYGRLSLWDFATARRGSDSGAAGRFEEALRGTEPSALALTRAAVRSLDADFEAIDAHLTVMCGAEAPSLRRVRDVLDDATRALQELGATEAMDPEEAAADDAPVDDDSAPARPAPSGPRTISSREDAFGVLLEVAAFFRRTEPHSPVPHALETIVRRGRMDFAGLVAELIPDEHQRREVLTRAGIDAASLPQN